MNVLFFGFTGDYVMNISKLMFKVEQALSELKDDGSFDAADYYRRAKALNDECGCSLGGVFVVLALIGVGSYALLFPQVISITTAILGVLSILVCGIAGKILGLAIARARLLLLYRTLTMHRREVIHVNMH